MGNENIRTVTRFNKPVHNNHTMYIPNLRVHGDNGRNISNKENRPI